MNTQNIEKYYARASGCLFFLTAMWGVIAAIALYCAGSAWPEADFALLRAMAIWFVGSLTTALLCYAAYAVIRSLQARLEAEPVTLSVHSSFVPDMVDPEYYR